MDSTLGTQTPGQEIQAPQMDPAAQHASPAPGTPSYGTTPPPAATAAETAQQQGVLDVLRGMGMDLSGQFQDDTAALQYLVGVHRQAQSLQQLEPYGRQYLQHADQFQAYLQQRQQAQQQQARPQTQPWWKAPEYDPSWTSKMVRDPVTGTLRAVDGAPPDLPQKYAQWVDHQRNFLDRFSQDPMKAIQPGVEEIARSIAEKIVSEKMGGYQEQVHARGFVEQNSSWLHARDQQGTVLYDQMTGKPQLSEWGNRFAQYVRQAEGLGLVSSEQQAQYAMGLVQRDYLLLSAGPTQNSASPGQQPVAQTDPREAFLQNAAARQQNASGSIARNGTTPQAPSQNPSLSLRDRLRNRFQQEGYQLSSDVAGA